MRFPRYPLCPQGKCASEFDSPTQDKMMLIYPEFADIELFAGKKPDHPRSPHWPLARRDHLKIQPFCMWTGASTSLEVHHIIPFHIRPDLELVQENLITLTEASVMFGNVHLVHGHLGNWSKINQNVVAEARESYMKLVLHLPNYKQLVAQYEKMIAIYSQAI